MSSTMETLPWDGGATGHGTTAAMKDLVRTWGKRGDKGERENINDNQTSLLGGERKINAQVEVTLG